MLEEKVDWTDELHEVRDQGPYPTCLSYATSTVHRVCREIDSKLSAESLHYTASGGDFQAGCNMAEIQTALYGTGQPKQCHCDPIKTQTADNWSPPSGVDYYKSASKMKDPSPDKIQQLIQDHQLPILGIGITDDFQNPQPPWIFSAGETIARHAVIGVGVGAYEGETVVLIRNSWGSQWADSGHAWLDYSYLKNNIDQLLLIQGDQDHD